MRDEKKVKEAQAGKKKETEEGKVIQHIGFLTVIRHLTFQRRENTLHH